MTRRRAPDRFLALVATLLALVAQGSYGQSTPPSQSSFLSIDCGVAAAYTDLVTGINWVPDGNYTSVGTNKAAVPGGSPTVNNTELQTLRYFKDKRQKFCYDLPVLKNQTYLTALTFWYGNYDGLNSPPVFNLAIDATQLVSIDLRPAVWSEVVNRNEYIRRTGLEQSSMSVCLYQDSTSVSTPFISSIELRLLDPVAYNQPWLDEGNFLFASLRQNFGGATTIRYPDDAYDRVWLPAVVLGTQSISTTDPVTDVRGLGIKPPSAIMQTAITPTNLSDLVIPYPYATAATPVHCVYYMYFAEISATATSTSREFTAIIPNDEPLLNTPINIYNITGGVDLPLVYYWTNMTITNSSAVTLAVTTPPSVDPPLVNAAELLAKFPTLTLPTDADDATAIEAIKGDLLLTSWSGDPCLPVPYDWITCSTTDPTIAPRVTEVNLDSYNLSGLIPAAFGQLTALTSLKLSNNDLSGSIPDSLAALPLLTELILTNNNLTGSVPTGLQKPGLLLDIRGNPACKDCGGSVSPAPAPTSSKTKKSSSNTGLIAGVVGGILAVVLIAVALLVVCCCIRKRNKAKKDKLSELPTLQFSNGSGGAGGVGMVNGSVQGAKAYSFAEITSATQNFNKKIGAGGFGPVYYGRLASGREVAVKVSDANSRQGVNEFNNEVQLLSRVHHRNLVSLVGYCLESKNQMLVYEFLHKGTVREHLYGSPLALQEPIDWKMRLDIALNSAQGLEYLHGGCTPSIIHRDVKSSNILLNDKYMAKVADFGLSKLGPEDGQVSHVSTMVKGTAGYLDPEYWSTNNLTEKSDVFSFGVVLLELLCGRQPIDNTLENKDEWNIVDKVRRSLQAGDVDSILDPVVKSCHPNMDSVWKVAEVALQSVEPKGMHRPFMRDVVREIREAIVLETGQSQTYSDQSTTSSANYVPSPRPGNDHSAISDTSSNWDSLSGLPHGR